MNDELQKQLAGLVEDARSTGGDVAEFIQQQAPELCEQLVAWTLYGGLADVAIGVLLMAFAVLLFFKTKAFVSVDPDNRGVAWAPGGIAVAASSVFGFFAAYIGASNAIKATVAPKLVVLDAISQLVR